GKKNSSEPKFLKEQRIRELKELPLVTLCEFAYQLEIGWDKKNRTIEKLNSEIEKKNFIIGERDKAIEDLKRKKNPAYKFEKYDKSKTGVEKIQFILECNNKGMSYNQIKDTLLLLEPELKEQWANVNRAVTDLLSKACKYGAIVKSKIYGNHGYYCYSLPSVAYTT
ncbi:MAG TPA: hypothetical protein VNX68_09730, partial [Nitrosopumilaceae archaeon]|nr:hypothetical protein [Nitrosopumilaceae archaeon]